MIGADDLARRLSSPGSDSQSSHVSLDTSTTAGSSPIFSSATSRRASAEITWPSLLDDRSSAAAAVAAATAAAAAAGGGSSRAMLMLPPLPPQPGPGPGPPPPLPLPLHSPDDHNPNPNHNHNHNHNHNNDKDYDIDTDSDSDSPLSPTSHSYSRPTSNADAISVPHRLEEILECRSSPPSGPSPPGTTSSSRTQPDPREKHKMDERCRREQHKALLNLHEDLCRPTLTQLRTGTLVGLPATLTPHIVKVAVTGNHKRHNTKTAIALGVAITIYRLAEENRAVRAQNQRLEAENRRLVALAQERERSSGGGRAGGAGGGRGGASSVGSGTAGGVPGSGGVSGGGPLPDMSTLSSPRKRRKSPSLPRGGDPRASRPGPGSSSSSSSSSASSVLAYRPRHGHEL